MKYVVLLGDGMADYPLEDRGGRTPLEISRTPAMDFLAARGRLGLVQTIPAGMEPGSDVANLCVMGYSPPQYYSGRAPIEAAGIGVELSETDVAFRCNLVTLEEKDGRLFMDDYSAGHISSGDAARVIESVKRHMDSADITFYPGVSYRHLMVWAHGETHVQTTPPHDISGREVTGHLPRGEGADRIGGLMKQSREFLPSLEVNRQRSARGEKPVSSIWLWGQGRRPAIPLFSEKYGLSGAVISAVDLIKGLGISAGLNSIDVPGATGYLDTNYEGKARDAIDALAARDFVYVHVEAPDEASHKGILAEKIQAIEDFDARVVQPVLNGLQQMGGPYRLLVLPDHATPLATKTHAAEPVPFILFTSEDHDKQPDQKTYCEKDAAAAGELIEDGWTLMDTFI